MRNGTNPNRLKAVQGYKPIVISAITHLPNMKDYHEKRWDVVQCSLETMRRNAGADCQILIWDNGSCAKFINWLKNHYKPDFLILSPNVGKSIARASIVRMLPPDRIVGVADDDMFYYEDWLKKQVKALKAYPSAGTVSGWPVRTQFRFHCAYTKEWGRRYAQTYERGKFISPQEDKDFCTSIGRDYYGKQINYTRNDWDYVMSYKGVKVYCTGHHAQWIGIAGVVMPYLEFTKECMPDERPFEKAINDAKLLRLTTFERTSRHIGNVLDEELKEQWLTKED